MAEHHLDHPGEWHWFSGEGPLPVRGECPHAGCPHNVVGVICHGPDFAHYELLTCDVEGGCAGECRGWLPVEPGGRAEHHRVIQWKHVAVPASLVRVSE